MKSLILSFLAFLFGSCQPSTQDISVISVDEFAQYITQPDVQLLDVRTPEELEAGHLEGSVMIDYRTDPDGFVKKVEAQLKKEQPVALYCRSGKRSHSAAEQIGRAHV